MNCNHLFAGTLLAGALFVLALIPPVLAEDPGPHARTPPPPPAEEERGDAVRGETFQLPGLKADLDRGYVDLDAVVCLDEGYLELVACATGTKEHESLVVVDAAPRHIHAALLLTGAVAGSPATSRKTSEGEGRRWVRLPPRGEEIAVSLVIPDGRGNENAFPISEFVRHHAEDEGDTPRDHASGDMAAKPERFPDRFLFAGSRLVRSEEGQSKYLADTSGHVVTIATFGDGVLCLPGQHPAANSELVWRVDPDMLPKVGTHVKLRLERIRPVEGDGAGADERGEG